MIYEIGNIQSSFGELLLRMWKIDVAAGKRTFYHHCHTQFEIGVVISGNGIYTTNSDKLMMEQGDVFIFSSNEPHCITEIGNQGLVLLNLQFEPRYLWGSSFDNFSEQNANICFAHNPNFNNKIPCSKSQTLLSIVNNIVHEFEECKSEYCLMVKSQLNFFLINLIRDFDYADRRLSLSKQQIKSIRTAVKYIDTHLSSNITLTYIAEISNMSPNYFSYLFKKTIGITAWDYILTKRIDLAIKYMTDDCSQENLLTIASKCGFNNTANFNKTFKKFTGMTPTNYKKMHNNEIL